jgi:hypothetical protein
MPRLMDSASSDAIDKYARAEAHIDRRLRTAFKNLIELKKAGLLEGRPPNRDVDFADEDGHEDDLRERESALPEEEDDLEEEEDGLLEAELLETANLAEEPEPHEMSDSTQAPGGIRPQAAGTASGPKISPGPTGAGGRGEGRESSRENTVRRARCERDSSAVCRSSRPLMCMEDR